MKCSLGFDIHRLVAGRPLIIGGVKIDHDKGLEGDSDADVLTHAIIDALCGSKCLGDIGSYFGVGTPEVMGSRSLDLLAVLLTVESFDIEFIDATIIAQEPKMSHLRDDIRKSLSLVMGLPMDKISIKFTTPKHIGHLGSGEGIACLAIVTTKE
ncbi:MAG: 2-C-methyl-D-erythritol 2,4-cyclodiphosphate synthase [Caldiserica bacterium]|nr:2-C-methyl-D-erythritol 2,4-cyclodiphosphate synthase [Caldisericota bacterium]